jgi:Zn-dependent M28 family amino/carboxypeptidase
MVAKVVPSIFLAALLFGSIACNPAPQAQEDASDDTRALIDAVSATELRRTIDDLVGFGTRHTLSETRSDTHGIGAARRYLLQRFESFAAGSGRTGDLTPRVYLDRHTAAADGRRIPVDTEIVNVVMELPGRDPESRARRVYVIGHYDSRVSDPMNALSDAPGANDDGSGTALTVELARVLASTKLDATLVFMATAGEEQGLYGAGLHAAAAREAGLQIDAVLSNDIVGDPTGAHGDYPDEVRVFSEPFPQNPDASTVSGLRRLSGTSDSASRQLARYVEELGRRYELPVQARLVFRTDRFLRGGDHTAFNREGFPAIRFTEVSENYDRQHQDVREEDGVLYGDRPEYVDENYLANVARLNLTALVHLASAPSIPRDARIITAKLTNDTTLRWSASPEADVAGYEIVWRETSAPHWQGSVDVGNVTEATRKRSKDNFFFGVRAYDSDGFRSPTAFPSAAKE